VRCIRCRAARDFDGRNLVGDRVGTRIYWTCDNGDCRQRAIDSRTHFTTRDLDVGWIAAAWTPGAAG
jgi:hypothetical protein